MSVLRILQKPLAGEEKTVPELTAIRELLESKIPKTDVTGIDINRWLQAPPSSKETKEKEGPLGKSDNDCEQRATSLAKMLKPPSASDPKPKLFSTTIGTLAAQWAAVDKALKQNTPVIIKGLDTFIGGEKSNFRSGRSHHVVLFLAAGEEAGQDFYVGYDPDVSATDATKAAWETADSGDENSVISSMVLGTGKEVLGPLCRKYYVDKTRVFPPIPRV